MSGDQSSSPPLEGLVVADFSRVLAGPMATMILGDLGATVIKVERPISGDDTRAWGPPWMGDESTYFLAANRNKRSLTLDLAEPEDRVIAYRLASRCDVLVENFRPGSASRFGLGYAEVAEDNPRVVYASVSGFGLDKSVAHLGGYDFVIQAMAGLMSLTGEADGQPLKVGVALIDVLTGLYTAIGILAALRAREETGVGQQVSVSLFDTALASLANQASAFLAAGVVPERMGNSHPSIVPYQMLDASDRPLVVAVGSNRLFAILSEVIGLPGLAHDERFAANSDRVANRGPLIELIESALRQRPAADWVGLLRERGVPAAQVNDLQEAFAEAVELGLEPTVSPRRTDGTAIPTVRSPMRLSSTPVVVRHAPPRIGEHDAEVRQWLLTDFPRTDEL